MIRPVATLCLLTFPLALCAAEKPAVDKRAFSLANPTPDALLRELATDRPDVTESPFTVDAGRAQLEMDFASLGHDHERGVRTTSLAVAPLNLRLGLLANLEAGVFFDPYLRDTVKAGAGAKTSTRGVGDTVLRFKLNLWGNDDGETAFGIIADCKLPTAARALGNDKVEGSLTLPFTAKLGGGWEMGVMTVIAAGYDGSRYQPIWTNTVTLGRDLFENVGAFAEITSQAGDGAHVCTFDTGVTWQLNRNTQLDLGVNIGVSRGAPDAVWYTGLSRRF